MRVVYLFCTILVVAFMGGCSCTSCVSNDFLYTNNCSSGSIDSMGVCVKEEVVINEKEVPPAKKKPERVFIVIGEGIAPLNTISPAQALALAKRAAVADGYRQLGEKIYGVKISARDTVKNAALSSSVIVARVDGLIKNASIIDTSYVDGLYRVTMETKMSEDEWREIFSYWY